MTRGTVLAAAVLMLASCSSTAAPGSVTPFTDTVADRSIEIIVDNRNWSDARLYAIRRGARTSLGVVGGKDQRTFRMDWPIAETLQIEIHMLAGPRCLTAVLPVDPGDVLDLQIAVVFNQTSACG